MLVSNHGVHKFNYEARRFNSIDPLWEKYYGWTPYQYCGNNPIWAKDWDGKIIMSKKDQAQYKQLTAIARDVLPSLLENEDLISALASTAKVSKNEVKQSLKFDNLPIMNIVSLSHMRGFAIKPDEINISKGEVNWMESKTRPYFDPTQEVFNLAMTVLILHEIVETLNLGSGKPESGCSGSKFEKKFFGKSYNSVIDIKNDFDNIKMKLNSKTK